MKTEVRDSPTPAVAHSGAYAGSVLASYGPGSAGYPPLVPPLARVFAVGAHAGLRGQRWPFGRLWISPAGLRVRTPGRRSIDVSVPREAIISIAVGKGMYGQRLKIADRFGALQRVGIEVPFRRRRIIAELRRCGYVVHESRGLLG